MDYLLLNKPVIFFPYDLKEYKEMSRELQFNYNNITPGPKCFNQTELEEEILLCLKGNLDEYKEKREKMLDLAFKYKDGMSCDRIWSYIRENYIDKRRS
jgi:CDP-glycerol glycerophosphotransferase